MRVLLLFTNRLDLSTITMTIKKLEVVFQAYPAGFTVSSFNLPIKKAGIYRLFIENYFHYLTIAWKSASLNNGEFAVVFCMSLYSPFGE